MGDDAVRGNVRTDGQVLMDSRGDELVLTEQIALLKFRQQVSYAVTA